MLKKLFIASLMLAVSATANATLISINGLAGFASNGDITVDEMGEITEISYDNILVFSINPTVESGKSNDFYPHMTFLQHVETETPLFTADVEAVSILNEALGEEDALNSVHLWSVGGFSFAATEITHNGTKDGVTGLVMLGMLSHEGYEDTLAQYFISAQGLSVGVNNGAFSATVTSPAPISEPGTLAIFGLALVGFAASRKKKSA